MRIEKTYQLPFSTDRVYAAWISSDTVIPPATAMDINPVVGGHYRLVMDTPEFSGRNEGTFLSVDAGRRLVYTWEWNGDGEVSEIDVTFSPLESGTQIDLVHRRFRQQESVDQHAIGWDGYIEGLAAFLGRK